MYMYEQRRTIYVRANVTILYIYSHFSTYPTLQVLFRLLVKASAVESYTTTKVSSDHPALRLPPRLHTRHVHYLLISFVTSL